MKTFQTTPLGDEQTILAAEEERRQLADVVATMARLTASPDPSAVYFGIVAGARRLLGADRCAVFVLEDDRLTCAASVGISGQYIDGLLETVANRAGQGALDQLRDVRVIDMQHDPSVEASHALSSAEGIRTAAISPMTFQNNVIGVLAVFFDDPRLVASSETDLLRLFATQAASASANARIHAESRRRAERLGVLNEIGLALSGVLDLDALYEVVYQQTSRVLKVDSFYIALWDEPNTRLVFPYVVDKDKRSDGVREFPLGEGPSSCVVRTRKTFVAQPEGDPVQHAGIHFGDGPRSESALHVPMMIGERVVGVISVQSYEQGAYTPEDIQMLETVALQTAVAIENAHLFAEQAAAVAENQRLHKLSTHRAERLQVITEVEMAVSRVLDLEALYEVVFQQTGRVLKTDAFYIALWDEDRQVMSFPFQDDRGVRQPGVERNLGDGPTSWVLNNRKPFVYTGAPDVIHDTSRTFGLKDRSRSALHVPMSIADRMVGVMSAQSYDPDSYSEEDLQLLLTLAGKVAVAVENARLFQEQAAAAEEIRQLHDLSARRAERLRALNETGLALSGLRELDSLGGVVFQQTRRVLPVDSFYIALWNADRQTLTYSFFDNDDASARSLEHPISDGPSGWVVRNARSYKAESNEDALHMLGMTYGTGQRTESALHVPMLIGDRVLGVVSAQSFQINAYTDEDLQMLETLAGQTAVAVDNAMLYKAVHHAALTDELTGLPNRRAMTQKLQEELDRSGRYGQPLCLLLMDVDHFKAVNDTWGHAAGDSVLVELSQLLRRSLRGPDIVGRWGGEEFLVVLVHTDAEGAHVAAENLRAAVAAHDFLNGAATGRVSTSIGAVAVAPGDETGIARFLQQADECLYRAKAGGRNRVVFRDQPPA